MQPRRAAPCLLGSSGLQREHRPDPAPLQHAQGIRHPEALREPPRAHFPHQWTCWTVVPALISVRTKAGLPCSYWLVQEPYSPMLSETNPLLSLKNFRTGPARGSDQPYRALLKTDYHPRHMARGSAPPCQHQEDSFKSPGQPSLPAEHRGANRKTLLLVLKTRALTSPRGLLHSTVSLLT